jgi:hypothetical protein
MTYRSAIENTPFEPCAVENVRGVKRIYSWAAGLDRLGSQAVARIERHLSVRGGLGAGDYFDWRADRTASRAAAIRRSREFPAHADGIYDAFFSHHHARGMGAGTR